MFIKVQQCLDCFFPELYQIKMEQSLYGIKWGQYMLTYDDVHWTLDFNIPNGVDQWYVVYSVTHKPITSYTETICIDPRLLPWVKLMLRKYLAENAMEINLAQYYSSELEKWRAKKEKDMSGNLISVITTNVR